MEIEGKFSSKMLSQYPIRIETYGILGLKNADFNIGCGEADMFLFLKEMPSFETVFNIFLETPFLFLKFNKRLDICLSLFYKPYFSEFYDKIKNCYEKLSFLKKKYLIKYMLEYFANDIYYNVIVTNDSLSDKAERAYYIEKNIWLKSKELLTLIK